MAKRKHMISWVLPALLLLAALALVLPNRQQLWMGASVRFRTLGWVGFGGEGETLLIDQSSTAVERLDASGILRERICGERSDVFYHAGMAAECGGFLYVADSAYSGSAADGILTVSRLVELRGRTQRVVWQNAARPGDRDAGRVMELQVREGQVYFLLSVASGLELYRFAPGGSPVLIRRYYNGDAISGASVDLSTGSVAIAARRGYVRVQSAENLWVTLKTSAEHLMPQSISFRGGSLWVSELYGNRICRCGPGEEELTTLLEMEETPLSVEASADGEELLICTASAFCRLREGRTPQWTSEAPFARFHVTVGLWVLLVLGLASLLWLLRPVPRGLRELLRSESAMRVLIVVLAAAAVSTFVACSLMTELFHSEDEIMIENMHLFAEIAAGEVDTAVLGRISGERDYSGSAWTILRRPLDALISLARTESNYYSFRVYRADGERLLCLIDSDDSVMCGEPYRRPDAAYHRRVLEEGISCALRVERENGRYLYLLSPVWDNNADGDIAAVIEIRMDLSLHDMERRKAVFDTVLNVVCTTAVMMMLILEGIFLLTFVEEKRRLRLEGSLDGPGIIPVRTLMFFIYLGNAMQEPFIAVTAARFYQGGLPIPDSTARALPISAELLMMALSSAFAGKFCERRGARTVLAGGMGLQAAGYLLCLVLGNYWGLLFGKCLAGFGMGAVYVGCNTVAAAGRNEERREAGFSGVAAGTIAGLTVGGGLASVLLTFGGWRLVYLIALLVILPAFLLALFGTEVPLNTSDSGESAEDVQAATLGRFFLNSRIPVFFLTILLPFMMSASYRVYFFPLYAQDQNLSSVRVGQVYLLCGLAVLYLGPRLSTRLMKRVGPFRGVVLTSAVMGLGILAFVPLPRLAVVIAGVALLYAGFGVGSVCQYTWFQQQPECLAYGNGKSMSVYSVVENLGSTLGPVVFSGVLTLGYRQGLALFGGAFLLLTGIFAVITRRAGKYSDYGEYSGKGRKIGL